MYVVFLIKSLQPTAPVAATSKCLTQSNKSRMGREATKERETDGSHCEGEEEAAAAYFRLQRC
jgi:hypothetical protein